MKKKVMATLLMLATLSTFVFATTSCSKQESPTENIEVNMQEETEGGMQVSTSEESGIRLMSAKLRNTDYAAYGITRGADSAYTITATVNPTYATNTALNWTVNWVNPSSEWATGKKVTDYVTLSASSNTHKATVTCLKAFGEQIKIRAVAQSNANASAECLVDYSQKITGGYFRVTSNPNSAGNFFVCNLTDTTGYMLDTTYDYQGSTYILPVYSDYTQADTFTNACTFTYSTEFMSAITSRANSFISGNHEFVKTSWDLTAEEMPYTVVKIAESLKHPDRSTQNQFILSVNGAKSMIYELLASNPNMVIGYITLTCTGEYSTFENTIAVKASEEVLVQEVAAVSLDENAHVF